MGMCPACGTVAASPLFQSGDYRYVSCDRCESARLDPLPSLDPASLYGPRYFHGGTVAGGYADYAADEDLHRRNARDRLARLAAVGATAPGRLIEVGSGYGYFLSEAEAAGWDVTGTDVSAHAREQAAGLGLRLASDPSKLNGPADVLAMFQVLEHMLDPWSTFELGLALVRAGGRVIVETWDRSHWVARRFGRRWQQVSPPAVVYMFTSAGLLLMARRAGLVDVVIRPSPKYVSIGAAAGHVTVDRPRLRPAFDRIAGSRIGRRPIRYGFGDLVTMTARRP